MNPKRNLLIIAVLGAVAAVAGLVYHHHVVEVKAAKLEHGGPARRLTSLLALSGRRM